MSSLMQRFGRLFTDRPSATRTAFDPDLMSLRDWADLPSQHIRPQPRAALKP